MNANAHSLTSPDNYCACCLNLGKPRSRVNFLLLTGIPESPERVEIQRKLCDIVYKKNIAENLINLNRCHKVIKLRNQLESLNDETKTIEETASPSMVSNPVVSVPEVEVKDMTTWCYGISNLSLLSYRKSNAQLKKDDETEFYNYHSIDAYRWDELKNDILNKINSKPENEKE
ncbi:unnamed protein product, partial [Didymodactylos carnosus]